jgi:hypothetical protein
MLSVVNIRTAVSYTRSIARGSTCGNPFTHLPLERTLAKFQTATREDSITCFRQWLKGEPAIYDRFPELREVYWQNRRMNILHCITTFQPNDILGCYCKPYDCHGDVLVELYRLWRSDPSCNLFK